MLQRNLAERRDYQSRSGWDGQLSEERIPPIEGNLFKPGEGPARIEGPFTDRVLSSRHTFFTSGSAMSRCSA